MVNIILGSNNIYNPRGPGFFLPPPVFRGGSHMILFTNPRVPVFCVLPPSGLRSTVFPLHVRLVYRHTPARRGGGILEGVSSVPRPVCGPWLDSSSSQSVLRRMLAGSATAGSVVPNHTGGRRFLEILGAD